METGELPALGVSKNPAKGKLTVVVNGELEVTTYDTGLVYVNGRLINETCSDFDLHRIRGCVHDLVRIAGEEFDDPNYPRYISRALSDLHSVVERYLQ
jgi:hypothetical protein